MIMKLEMGHKPTWKVIKKTFFKKKLLRGNGLAEPSPHWARHAMNIKFGAHLITAPALD